MKFTRELLYNVIAVYFITVLIKTSVKFVLFQPVQRHGVYIAAYDMQLHVLLLYYLVPICRKLTVIYRQLGNNHLIQLLWIVLIHLKLGITSAKLGSKHNE